MDICPRKEFIGQKLFRICWVVLISRTSDWVTGASAHRGSGRGCSFLTCSCYLLYFFFSFSCLGFGGDSEWICTYTHIRHRQWLPAYLLTIHIHYPDIPPSISVFFAHHFINLLDPLFCVIHSLQSFLWIVDGMLPRNGTVSVSSLISHVFLAVGLKTVYCFLLWTLSVCWFVCYLSYLL